MSIEGFFLSFVPFITKFYLLLEIYIWLFFQILPIGLANGLVLSRREERREKRERESLNQKSNKNLATLLNITQFFFYSSKRTTGTSNARHLVAILIHFKVNLGIDNQEQSAILYLRAYLYSKFSISSNKLLMLKLFYLDPVFSSVKHDLSITPS